MFSQCFLHIIHDMVGIPSGHNLHTVLTVQMPQSPSLVEAVFMDYTTPTPKRLEHCVKCKLDQNAIICKSHKTIFCLPQNLENTSDVGNQTFYETYELISNLMAATFQSVTGATKCWLQKKRNSWWSILQFFRSIGYKSAARLALKRAPQRGRVSQN